MSRYKALPHHFHHITSFSPSVTYCSCQRHPAHQTSASKLQMRERIKIVKREHDMDLEKLRLVSDLRIMHSKVDELHHIVSNLRQRHSESDVIEFADESVLAENIRRVDEIYL
jgi:hypothetical protein